MGKIKVLDKNISNMIAAGEVVERPASVIKELLENSIDAGAKHITVEIKNGGVKYIRVADDGIGMTKEDASVSLLRHATSKISTAEDLDAILTLGFRGEALASIAAVSNMEIYTKAREEKEGTLIKSSCGEITDTFDAGCPDGTTIIVRDLFVNTPARMKFLKKDHTEAGYIADIITRLSLAKPDISFKFINNDKEQIFTTGDGELINAIYAIYGKDIKNAMVHGAYSEFGISLSGYFGKSEASRPNRNMQNVFVNGRYIKSPLISHAVEEAYKQELMTGKFPSCIINLEIDPHCVDINVHPTKLEAKFSDEKAVYHVVYWATKNALYQKKTVPVVEKNIPEVQKKEAFEKLFSGLTHKSSDMRLNESAPRVRKEGETPKTVVVTPVNEANVLVKEIKPQVKKEDIFKFSADTKESSAYVQETITKTEIETETPPLDEPLKQETVTAKLEENIKPAVSERSMAEKTVEEKAETEIKEQPLQKPKEEILYRICGQVFDTYIIIEKDGKMMMVDQHAAHERLRFEALKEGYKNRQVASQTLMIPAVIKLTPTEMAIFEENFDDINSLGFFAEEFGENEVIVRSVPVELTDAEIKETMVEIISLYSSHRKNIDEQLVEKMLYSIACKGAVKANKRLHETEMKKLLDSIFALPEINTCPHGRPITIAFTKEFIEKQFKRIV